MNTATTTTPSSNMLSVPSSTSSSSGIDINNPTRPAFNSQRTQDRLREGEGLYAMLFRSDSNKLQRGRKSVFKETGLDDDSASEVTDVSSLRSPVASPSPLSPTSTVSSQGPSPLPPFPCLKPGPLESWYVWAAHLACFGPRRLY
ncbi:S/T/P-rich small unique protein [Trichoderma guizhouense]|uniref:S/T/P-rich small unique protein n=1 Tax=Trichoderma guizhouense TaxID=1491466 RepID=A0A1T3CRH3_9HYPO|nr:S/T/P-rich small unique protein [Trichoderma guizhouense]